MKKKKSEVEIQSKGIEQKAKREIQVGRITQVTPLDFNFCHLIAFFFKEKYSVFPNHATRKSHNALPEVQD